MTEQELKERGDIYRQLVEYAPFQYFLKEMKEKQEDIRDGISECLTPGDDKLYDKGIRAGIRTTIETPAEAIKEAEQLTDKNEENS